MSFSCVIFDCDGVLIDSEVLSAETEAMALRRHGIDISTERAMGLFLGLTHDDMERLVLREFGFKFPPDHIEKTMEILREVYKERLQAIPGVRAVIEKLTVPICVASNSPPSKLGLGLSLTGLFELLYPHIYCSALVPRGKPAPDLFLYAARALKADPKTTAVVEDSVAGVTAAKAAGMTAIGFIGGLHHGPPSADRLRAVGADHVVETMEEVGALLGV